MTSPKSIDAYCLELAAKIPAGTLRGGRVVQEVRGHLEELARTLTAGGAPADEAEPAAIRQFGSVDEIAGSFADHSPLEPENEPMVRLTLGLLVAATSLFALALIVFTIIGDDDAMWWSAAKIVGGAFVLIEGGLTLVMFRDERLRGDVPRLIVFLAGLVLIAVGSACGVWSAHLGVVTGDWDGFAGVGAILLCLQGAATAWLARPNLPRLTPGF